MPWGFAAAAIGAAGSIGGALIGSSASKSAASTQANAANQATKLQEKMFNTTQGNLAPYMGAGTNALAGLQNWIGLGPGGSVNPNAPGVAAPNVANFQQSPGYKWQFDQGINAIDNSASAKGFTGNTLKDLTAFGQGLANQDWWNWYNSQIQNQNRQTTNLANLAGSGQNAATNLGGFSGQTGGQIGQNIIGAGNAQAAGQVGAANAFSGGLNNASQLAFLYQMMNQGGGGGTPPTPSNLDYWSPGSTGAFYQQ